MKKIPSVNDFQEFPLTEKEINEILFTMKSEFCFVLDAKRYEKAQVRYEERKNR